MIASARQPFGASIRSTLKAGIPWVVYLALLKWYVPFRLHLDQLGNFGMKVTAAFQVVLDLSMWVREDVYFAIASAVGLLLILAGYRLFRYSWVLRVLWTLVVVALPLWLIVHTVRVVEDAAQHMFKVLSVQGM